MNRDDLAQQLAATIEETSFEGLGTLRKGKVRDIYDSNGRMYFLTTDRVSAFDRVITTIPFKGCVLTSLAAFWFEKTRDIVENHLQGVPHPNVMQVEKLRPVEVEMVVRAYITGVTSTSLWTLYAGGERIVSGNRLPEGLRKNDRLPEPIITPSTKAHTGHDRTVSPGELVESGAISRELYDELSRLSLELFRRGSERCAEKGLILVDTKYEFGLDGSGRPRIMDEIHTPDSSRFWDAASYEASHRRGEEPASLDKEYVRRWLKSAGYAGDGAPPRVPDEVRVEAAAKYIEAYEKITGKAFEPPYDDARRSVEEWAARVTS